MATQTDTAQLKKLGLILLGLGVVMAAVGYLFMDAMWQVYGGLAAAGLGLALTVFALKKG